MVYAPIHFTSMFTLRPFCNEDPPKLLNIWQQNRCGPLRTRYMSMSVVEQDAGPLGIPFFDRRCLQLAFDDERPVGFAHASFAPKTDGSGLSTEVGHIAVVVVVPDCPEPVVVCKELIQACENVLITGGAREIFGGSPRPSLPFYLGLYGGADPIGIFDADAPVIEAFRQLGYEIHEKTRRFDRELTNYQYRIRPATLRWKGNIQFQIDDFPLAKNWLDAVSLAHCEWLEFLAIQTENSMPVAKVRIRRSPSGADQFQRMYDDNWNAALTDIRVHPDFHRKGLGTFVLSEILRFLAKEDRTARIEAHITDSCSSLCGLLCNMGWREVETGTIFVKKFHSARRAS